MYPKLVTLWFHTIVGKMVTANVGWSGSERRYTIWADKVKISDELSGAELGGAGFLALVFEIYLGEYHLDTFSVLVDWKRGKTGLCSIYLATTMVKHGLWIMDYVSAILISVASIPAGFLGAKHTYKVVPPELKLGLWNIVSLICLSSTLAIVVTTLLTSPTSPWTWNQSDPVDGGSPQ